MWTDAVIDMVLKIYDVNRVDLNDFVIKDLIACEVG